VLASLKNETTMGVFYFRDRDRVISIRAHLRAEERDVLTSGWLKKQGYDASHEQIALLRLRNFALGMRTTIATSISHSRRIDQTDANVGRKFPEDSALTGRSPALDRLAQALAQLVPFVGGNPSLLLPSINLLCHGLSNAQLLLLWIFLVSKAQAFCVKILSNKRRTKEASSLSVRTILTRMVVVLMVLLQCLLPRMMRQL